MVSLVDEKTGGPALSASESLASMLLAWHTAVPFD